MSKMNLPVLQPEYVNPLLALRLKNFKVLLVGLSGVKVKWYYSLMPDPPEVLRFIKNHHPDVKIIRPEFSFYAGCHINFPPHRKAR